jgi:hypothetical protein
MDESNVKLNSVGIQATSFKKKGVGVDVEVSRRDRELKSLQIRKNKRNDRTNFQRKRVS